MKQHYSRASDRRTSYERLIDSYLEKIQKEKAEKGLVLPVLK